MNDDMRVETDHPNLCAARTAFAFHFDSACRVLCAAFLAAAVASPVFAQADLSRMLNLLDATPDGGWVQVNTNKFSDAWVSGPDALPSGSYSDQAAIIHAWSSFAWDSNRGNLLLWGGGHANYMGNEMYVWQGSTGLWTRGSVSSRLERYNTSSTYFTVDNAAPQSAHTYDNNLFLPLNDLFITFGGAAFNSGGVFVNKGPSGTPVRAGPWLWDPRKADPNKVGGTTGSGYNTLTPGGQMWTNQQGKWVGAEPPSYTEATSAYVVENGQDVVYVTGDSNASGWPSLYRYEPGNARAGATGRFEKVAIAWNAPGYQSTGAIDTVNRVYVRISKVSNFPSGVGVWDLTKISASNPSSVTDKLVRLALPNSSFFDPNVDYGMEFDSARGKFVLWDGHQGGTVYETQSVLDSSRNIAATWTITAVPSATAVWPTGNYQTGVLGKWRFVKELGAFVALDEFQSAAADAAVWLYRPVGWRRPGSGGGGNVPPSVVLTSPANGASAAAPGSFVVSANASDTNGTVSRVDFYAGSTLIGSDNSAPYSVTWSNVPAGSYTLTAVAVDNAGASTTSSAVQVAVNAITIASSANPVAAGTSVTFTASVTGNAPTGGVTFADAGSTITGCNAVPLTGTGSTRTAACVTSSLAVGVRSITASYNGDTNNHFVTSAPLSQVVNSGFTSTNVALAGNGGVASASTTYVGGGMSFPAASVNNGDRTGLGWGSGGGWNDATAGAFPDWVQINFNGQKTIDHVIVYTLQDNFASPVDPPNTLTFTQYGVTAFQVQGWNGTSWITLGSVSGNNLVKRTVNFTATTTARIRVNITGAMASYSRITEIEAWTSSGVAAATTTTLASSTNPSTAGASVTFTATVTGIAPTGNVNFTNGGVSITGCSAVALTGSGNTRTAACSTSTLAAGTRSIVANYGGDAGNVASASAALSQVVNGGAQINVALAGNGGVASASSTYAAAGYSFPVASVNNGDRTGLGWGSGGGWNDATAGAFPDWVQINFSGQKTIDHVIVYTLQDNFASPVDPPNTLTFTQYGVTAFQVQGWNGSSWVTVGSVSGNNLVKRTVNFTATTTDRIRVNITGAMAIYSRITEIEAWGN